MIDSAAEFVRLVESDDEADRKRSAWEDAPIEVWLELVEQRPDMHFWVAHNRRVPDEVMRVLVKSSDWRVRNRIASKAACPSDILAVLAGDHHDSVASSVASHPNTPVEALRSLAVHDWEQVRDKAIRQLEERGETVSPVDGNS